MNLHRAEKGDKHNMSPETLRDEGRHSSVMKAKVGGEEQLVIVL